MYANEFETKEKQKLPEIKNYLQHIQNMDPQSMDHPCGTPLIFEDEF